MVNIFTKIKVIFRILVAFVFLLYLILAFKDPGYVTSHILKGDEFEEEDMEVTKNYYKTRGDRIKSIMERNELD